MDWHSTQLREELIFAIDGRVRIECRDPIEQSVSLSPGQCLFIPVRTRHRVINSSRVIARYVYVTASSVQRR